jgi:hypothetical protein
MQDRARLHIASLTMAFLKAMLTIIEDRPVYSPDLNPTENMWTMMKR